MIKTKTRDELIQIFIDSLTEEKLPWEKPWRITEQYNFLRKKYYRGINAWRLSFEALKKGYEDPRWMTMKQIQQKKFHLQKGSKGVPVEYFLLHHIPTDKYYTISVGNQMIRNEEVDAKDFKLAARTTYVFNCSCIEGVPKYEPVEPTFVPEHINNALFSLADEMGVNVEQENYIDQASYSPFLDRVKMPLAETFKDYDSYSATFLHELGHATGHESRLDRNLSTSFGEKEYAIEELRVELSAAMMSNHFPYTLSEEHINQHKAYIQSWISVFRNDPNVLFRAIKDADKIVDYMVERLPKENIFDIDFDDSFLYEETNAYEM